MYSSPPHLRTSDQRLSDALATATATATMTAKREAAMPAQRQQQQQQSLPLEFDDLRRLTERKELELQAVLAATEQRWQRSLDEKQGETAELKKKLLVLQEDFLHNVDLLRSRDTELDGYESQLMDMTDAVKQRDAMLVQIRADVAEREQRLRQESLSLRDHVDGVMEPLRSGLDTLRTRVDTELSTVHAAVEELRQKLGDTGVKSLAEVVDEKIGATRDQMTATMADVQTSVGDVAWKQEVFERIALELDQRVVAMDERVGTLEDQIMTQTRSLLTDYHTMNAREAKSILDMELATIRDAMAARFAKLHGDLGARVDSVDADVERLQLSVEHQAAMLEERLVSERRDAERRAESHANVVDRSLRDGIATFEKSLDGKLTSQFINLQTIIDERARATTSELDKRMSVLEETTSAALSELRQSAQEMAAKNRILEERLLRHVEVEIDQRKAVDSQTADLVKENSGLKQVITMMRQEMEQLHEQQMQQSARDAAYMSERTALLSPVAHDNNIEELRGQISSLIGMMEDLSHKIQNQPTAPSKQYQRTDLHLDKQDRWKLIEASNALRAEIKDLRLRNDELELHAVMRRDVPTKSAAGENAKPNANTMGPLEGGTVVLGTKPTVAAARPSSPRRTLARKPPPIRNYNVRDEQ